MLEQPIPTVTEEDVRRIVRREFGEDRFPDIWSLLDKCDRNPRVRAAILKLAAGDIDRLKEAIGVALQDCRDVLAAAEYPNYSKKIAFDGADESLEQTFIADDWKQYREWFEAEQTF